MKDPMMLLLSFIFVLVVLLLVLCVIITKKAKKERLLENQAEVEELKRKKKLSDINKLIESKTLSVEVNDKEEIVNLVKEQDILKSLKEDGMAISKKANFEKIAKEDKLKQNIESLAHELVEEKEDDEINIKDQRSRSTILGVETYIEGDLVVDGDLEILGAVKGNIQCSGNMRVLGKVDGNIQSSSLYVNAILMKGDLYCEEKLENKEGTMIQGNITARVADIEGEVEGNIHISELLILGDCAAVNGDIAAGDIEIHRGAYVQGQVSIITEENE